LRFRAIVENVNPSKNIPCVKSSGKRRTAATAQEN